MRDLDQTGKLDYEEFTRLWDDLQMWKGTYKQYDKDQSGHFNSCELREALKAVGYQVSNATFSAIVVRFTDRDGLVRFDDFVACLVKLKTMFDVFAEKVNEGIGMFSLDEFIQMTIYC